jgi:hypothetical protein
MGSETMTTPTNVPTKRETASMDSNETRARGGRPRALALAVVALSTTLGACDFDVINPGPVEDQFLDRPDAHAAVVAGAARQLADGLDNVAITTAAVSREVFPSGSTGSFGISPFQQEGIIFFDDTHVAWTDQQRARFTAEDAFRRFEESEEVDVSSYDLAAEAALLAGYANRLLGENYCQAIIDGGEPQPSSVFLTRAEDWFSQAITIGTAAGTPDLVSAAYAGRASVRVDLGNWSGAVSDAAQVPEGFVYEADYNQLEQNQFNRLYWAGAGQPYKSHTTWNTQWEEYYVETGDPRVPWAWRAEQTGPLFDAFVDGPPANDLDAVPGDAAVAVVEDSIPNGNVPHFPQMKYPEEASDIRLSSKWEMNLIEAEAALRDGNITQAFELMNLRRADLGIATLDPTGLSLNEAWTLFKRERGIELWLEARRMNDIRRWQEEGTPGDLHPLEQRNPSPEAPSFLREAQQLGESTLCYPIPRGEREANENLPLQPTS